MFASMFVIYYNSSKYLPCSDSQMPRASMASVADKCLFCIRFFIHFSCVLVYDSAYLLAVYSSKILLICLSPLRQVL